jgi:outer membrane protein assembly factor BamB
VKVIAVHRTRTWLAFGTALTASIPSIPSIASAAEAPPSHATLIASPEPGWPQFRGPRRDGISDERGLLPAWPEGGPKLLWSATGAGKGFSSPTIAGGRLYITGDFGEDVRVLAFDLQGKPLWSVKNGAAWLNQYQGARSTVTFFGGRIYHENAHGRVACLDAATGKELWSVDLLARFGGENITWGLSECLLVDERAVYATAGGRDALLVALDRMTGEVLWRSPAVFDPETKALDNAGYASPILVRFAGRRLIIGCSQRHLYCVDADSGTLQWTRHRPTTYGVLAGTPVLVGNAVFVTAPFGLPGRLYRLVAPARPAETIGVEDAWSTALDSAQGGVVHANGRLFGSTYPRRGTWLALDAATGATLFEAPDLVKGSAVHADNRLYVLSEDGWMQLIDPSAGKFEIKGRFQPAPARDRDAWAHPVIHDGRLYLRYHDTLRCYDIRRL